MNFKFLHQALQKNNLMNIPCLDSFAAPLVYPYRTNNLDLKKSYSMKIYSSQPIGQIFSVGSKKATQNTV